MHVRGCPAPVTERRFLDVPVNALGIHEVTFRIITKGTARKAVGVGVVSAAGAVKASSSRSDATNFCYMYRLTGDYYTPSRWAGNVGQRYGAGDSITVCLDRSEYRRISRTHPWLAQNHALFLHSKPRLISNRLR